jgi:dolichol-phosphate mannosyltransferase
LYAAKLKPEFVDGVGNPLIFNGTDFLMTDNTKPAVPAFSVVVPVYRCSGCLEGLCERLERALENITARYEIILVDDRSPDDAWLNILAIQKQHKSVRGVRLSRNFGQHIAITAGLSAARGDVAVVLDCDLQDPPELIADLYARLLEGHDYVVARRVKREHSTFRIMGAKAYFWLLSRLAGGKIDGSYGSYSILTRKVIDAFLSFSERERHYLFILRWLGFNAGTVDYPHQTRVHGPSSYSLSSLVRHAIDGIFFQSTVLLTWIAVTGMALAAAGGVFALGLIYRYFILGAQPGWTSLAVLILISTGLILIGLGVVGIYIGKIFEQIKGRPLYVVDTISESVREW